MGYELKYYIIECLLLVCRLFSLLEKIISVGMNHSNGVLEFTHGVLVLLGQRASSVENGETLRRMWSIVTMPLLSHIVKVIIAIPAKTSIKCCINTWAAGIFYIYGFKQVSEQIKCH